LIDNEEKEPSLFIISMIGTLHFKTISL
jgi:hypothetical protein